jgi:hypothetical protein
MLQTSDMSSWSAKGQLYHYILNCSCWVTWSNTVTSEYEKADNDDKENRGVG